MFLIKTFLSKNIYPAKISLYSVFQSNTKVIYILFEKGTKIKKLFEFKNNLLNFKMSFTVAIT